MFTVGCGAGSFVTEILPRYLRKTKAIEELVPWLYLKGISTGEMPDALVHLGFDGSALSATSVVRMLQAWQSEHADWRKRDLTGKRYVYLWADGQRESETSWTSILLYVKNRGISQAPELVTGDGSLGFWVATSGAECTDAQRPLDKLPKNQQSAARRCCTRSAERRGTHGVALQRATICT